MAGYLRYDLSGLLTEAAALLSLAVGLTVLSRDWRNGLQRSFFLITATGALWLSSIGMVQLVRDPNDAYLWITTNYVLAVPFISPSVYLFSVYWSGKRSELRVAKMSFGIALALGVIPMFLARQIFFFADVRGGIRFDHFSHSTVGLGYFWLIMLQFTAYAAFAFKNFFMAWRRERSPERRLQCQIFLIAAGLGYTGTIDFVVAYGINAYPFGYLSFTGFTLLMAYAIVRYRFLNVDIYLKKFSVIFLIYSILIALILPFAVPLVNILLRTESSHPATPIIIFSVAIGMALSVGPLIYTHLTRHNLWIREYVSTGITHELKSPLSTIQAALEMVQNRSSGGFDEGAEDYLRIIERNVQRLEGFVNDLLSVARIQDGKFTLAKSRFDLTEVVREEVGMHRGFAEIRKLQIDYKHNGPLPFEGDQQKIRQTISNLLSNAIKFSRAGHSISVSAHRNGTEYICAVADQGAGIPDHLLSKIFDRFVTGPNSSRGAGIGLAIAKGWVEAHGGRIWAESEGEGGTTVTFTLPCSEPS